MKVIFLDIDGVLNNSDSFIPTGPYTSGTMYVVDSECITNFNRITDETSATIVISSAWRTCSFDVPTFLQKRGVTGTFIGETPRLRGEFRSGEIQKWLDKHPEAETFIIIDDMTRMEHLQDRLVQTSMKTGLTSVHADEAIEMLQQAVL